MNNNESRADKLRTIYKNAEAFLYEIAPKEIHSEMEQYFVMPEKKETKADILKVLLGSLQNRNRATGVIGLWNNERAPIFKEIFFDYNADAILEAYTADTLLECFKKHFEIKNTEKSGLWSQYSKSVISACQYLNGFNSAEDFDTYVKRYTSNDAAREELANILAKEIFGMGFALACDFLKDLGYIEFAKPDVHVKDILCAFDLCKNDDIAAYRTIVEMANAVGKTPYAVDKVLWIIGSGNFYLHETKAGRKKEKFIERVRAAL